MKIKILFVDDDQETLSSLRTMLYSMYNEWEVYFAHSGNKALELLENQAIDIIISDISMPDMNGFELLKKVKDLHASIIRIIISDQADQDLVLKSSDIAHQFLAKPFDASSLRVTIKKTFQLRNYLQNERLLKVINGIGKLPKLPNIYIELEKALENESVPMKKISEIISTDITMSAKILQFVNSAFFGLPTTITSIPQAVNYLGKNIIKTLILYIQLFGNDEIEKKHKPFLNNIWQHSLLIAKSARNICLYKKLDQQDIDDVYIAGMLHDIGKLVMLSLPDYPQNVVALSQKENINFTHSELVIYETSHAEIGAYLLGIWGLPDTIVEAVAYHHLPSTILEPDFSILSALHIANSYHNNMAYDNEFLILQNLNSELDTLQNIVKETV